MRPHVVAGRDQQMLLPGQAGSGSTCIPREQPHVGQSSLDGHGELARHAPSLLVFYFIS